METELLGSCFSSTANLHLYTTRPCIATLDQLRSLFATRECKRSHHNPPLAPSINVVDRYSVLSVMYWCETHGPSLTAKPSNSNRCPTYRQANRSDYSMMCGGHSYSIPVQCQGEMLLCLKCCSSNPGRFSVITQTHFHYTETRKYSVKDREKKNQQDATIRCFNFVLPCIIV